MARVGKSRSTVLVVLVAALALVATPAVAPAQGPDEYSLNLPDGGGGETAPDGSSGGGSEPVDAAPVDAAPTAPTVPVAPTTEDGETVVVDDGRSKPKREKPEPILGSTSLNGRLGAQRIPTLKVPEGEERSALVPLGVAGLAGACCLLAVWRLRYRREEPTAPAPPKAAGEAATKPRQRTKPPRESAAAARVRGDRRRARPAATKAKSTRRSRPATRGASSR